MLIGSSPQISSLANKAYPSPTLFYPQFPPKTPRTTHKMSCSFSTAPGEQFEVRQTSSTSDWHPDPSKSLPLSPARQALLDDILALYSCEPTVERVKRYTPDCVYDDQFVYANDRYKMAGQWFALPKLFKKSVNEGYEVVRSDDEVLQFKNEQVCFPRPPFGLVRFWLWLWRVHERGIWK